MESLDLARQSVSADVSEFARAELTAFVDMARRCRPASWARVEQLQQACRFQSPATGPDPGGSIVPLRQLEAA